MQQKNLVSWGIKLTLGVVGLVSGSISLIILAIVLIILLFVGGCAAIIGWATVVMTAEVATGQIYFKQASNSSLPDNVEFLVSRQGFYPFYNDPVLPNKDGHYALTAQGLYNFATGEHTSLTCDLNDPNDKNSSNGDDKPLYLLNNYIGKSFWLDAELFLWQDCFFEAETLKPGIVIEHQQSYSTLEKAKTKVQEILQEMEELDGVYYQEDKSCGYCSFKETYFVQRPSHGPPLVHIVEIPPEIREKIIQATNLVSISYPSLAYQGCNISENTERLSPNGQLKALFDGKTLMVKQVADDVVISQVNVQEFHKIGFFGKAKRSQHMEVYGWTDDSKRILFSVRTRAEIDYNPLLEEPLIIQTFVLNIP